MHTEMWSSQLRRGGVGEEEKAALIKSRDPHLAGGELHTRLYIYNLIYIYIYICTI
jgi:hypothetical protein